MMLGLVTKEMELSTARVKNVNREFGLDVCVAKVDKGELLFVNYRHYEELINSYQHLEGVKMEDNRDLYKIDVYSERLTSDTLFAIQTKSLIVKYFT